MERRAKVEECVNADFELRWQVSGQFLNRRAAAHDNHSEKDGKEAHR
jgi:hypothetical protein